jgi:Holliday junction DNA helicase RuvA
LQAPLSTFFVLPECGESVILITHFIVREDAQLLYGFATKEECRLFQEIIKVSGVGPKVALAILSGLSPQEFIACVANQEASRLQCLPGIGLKTAQRILVEMSDRLAKLNIEQENKNENQNSMMHEATLALVSLGYKPQEASKAVAKVQKAQTLPFETSAHIIREALQGLAKV